MRIAALLLVALLACNDDSSDLCAPTPPAAPTTGPFADPRALELPGDCVEGGLRDLPGRWFVAAPASLFNFGYPKFEGSCDAGFRRALYNDEDHDLSDGVTFHSWSDGTRVYHRLYYRYERPGQPVFEYANAFAGCLLPDGTMAGVSGLFDTDRGPRIAAMTGKRFAPKDDAPVGLALVGELGRRPNGDTIVGYNVAIDGTLAYVVGATGFDVIDVASPAAPVLRGHLDGEYNDVKIVRSAGKIVAYLSPIGEENTLVVDVTNPAAPAIASQINEYSHSVQTQVRGAATLLYLATYTNDIPVYDVTSPLAPVRVGAAHVPGEIAGIHDLYPDGDRLYANNTTAGLVALDASSGLATAVELGRIKTSYSHASFAGTAGGRQVVLHGDEGMTPDGGAFLRVLDADRASPTFLQELARFQSRPEVGIHNFVLAGDKLYVAYYHDGVRVVDLANPTQPREIAHYNTWNPDTAPGGAFEGALGIKLANNLIYVADLARGLLILRDAP